MKISDYIVDFLVKKQITDVFGYPGGMVTHLMDSLNRNSQITAHVNYHEQASAFAACGYAQASGKVGVAYATSGPGATNLITGICNAWFDSVSTLFITGQVNTFELKGNSGIRQNGFQETDIVGMVRDVTKYAVQIEKAEEVPYHLEKAWHMATEGRRGPVLLDIPMNILRADIEVNQASHFVSEVKERKESVTDQVVKYLAEAERPCIIAGAGIHHMRGKALLHQLLEKYSIPVVTSMPGVGILSGEHERNYGFLGAYGNRTANFIVAKADLILTLGTRLDIRQVGAKKENFAPDARLVRIDIDESEFNRKVKADEISICADACEVMERLTEQELPTVLKWTEWTGVCDKIRLALGDMDMQRANTIVKKISTVVGDECAITTDVGQNQVWIAQSFSFKENQKVLFSSGHGAMGYSLPAAIGAYFATRKPVVCFNGDGGIQMNIQELQFIAREQIPVNVIVFNNYALGMIRHFQEMYFDSEYAQTTKDSGYTVPLFERIAGAYGIDYQCIRDVKDVGEGLISQTGPKFVEILLEEDTYVYPKLEYGKPNQDQEPLLDRELYGEIMRW